MDPETLLSKYSIVFQDVTLFNNSVMENIRIGKNGATDEEVMEAARLANCDEFVKLLPDQYNTNIILQKTMQADWSDVTKGERRDVKESLKFSEKDNVIYLSRKRNF